MLSRLFKNLSRRPVAAPALDDMAHALQRAFLSLARSPMPHPQRFDYETVACMLAAVASADYMTRRMQGARNLVTSEPLLADALDHCSVDGLVLEFGVYRGDSLRRIAQRAGREVHGFDSFEGLPEDWTHFQKRGRFSLDGAPPSFEETNVQLHAGWFDRTLPAFLATHPGAVRFLHVDCDLYSSTRTVLDLLAPRIVPGTVIVFDEYLNYPGWEQHEFRAFQEFITNTGRRYRYLAFASSRYAVSVVME
jgi:hypothetical protein